MPSRTFMRVSLSCDNCRASSHTRSISPQDFAQVGRLMYAAYAGTTDYEGETPEQAAEEVHKTVNGEYGEFSSECSKCIERDGRVVSATLVTRFQNRPFIAFSMTDPEFKNTGLGTECMKSAMFALQRSGETELRLVVTPANEPAMALYAKLGFKAERAGQLCVRRHQGHT